MSRILVTGSGGLVGTALRQSLLGGGHEVRPYDVRIAPGGEGHGDVLDRAHLHDAIATCDGIVHLAAVSRVVWGQRDPELCLRVNVEGTRNVVRTASASPRRPWIIFASSREIYGEPSTFPVREDAPIRPVNVYGRSKAAGERIVLGERGLRTAVVRLSNVFGSIDDHADRVIPAFTRAAAEGRPLQVCGRDHTFDFTPLEDTVRGISALVGLLEAGGAPPPPIHFVTGRATTLGELAAMAVRIAGQRSPIIETPPRSYDVAHFVGDPGRARGLLGWEPRVGLADALRRMIDAYRERALAIAV
jgi:nucleoside-diphosphate-sugar epimerase